MRAAFVVLALGVASIAAAQAPPQQVDGTELAASVNVPEKDVKVEGLLFLPKSATQVRALLVVINYGRTDLIYDSVEWRRAAESVESGILHARVSSVSAVAPSQSPEKQIIRSGSMGGSEALVAVVRRLAAESGHPELNDVPLAFWGWSAAAAFGTIFAQQYPQRTLAFIRYHAHRRGVAVDLNRTGAIPALLLAGGKDTNAGVDDAEDLWKSGRTRGAPWTFVMEPNVPHGMIDGNINVEFISNSNQLMIPWLTAVMRQRVPAAADRLRSIDPMSGWMGDNRTGEVWRADTHGHAGHDTSWLPDEQSARAWQRLREIANPARRMQWRGPR
jgi:hypothetical protein